MQMTAERQGEVTVVAIQGSVDALTAPEVMAGLEEHVRNGAARLVVDLSGVDYISSAGLRSLLAGMKAARFAGGDLRIASAAAGVERVLSMSGFTGIMKTYPDVQSAVAGFEG
jgi:anti-sigma B factor antagonist